jgi:integrase
MPDCAKLCQIVPKFWSQFWSQMDIDDRIDAANLRLKTGKLGVAIERRGGMLWLRGTFPPKPGNPRTQPYRQKLSLGLRVNIVGVQEAEKQAKLLGAELQLGRFDWSKWGKDCARPDETIADWIERFTCEFQHTVEPITWKTDYKNVFGKLPGQKILAIDTLKEVIDSTKPHTRTRRRCALAFERLAKFASLEADFSHLRGNYSASEVEPRDIPSDRLIAECWQKIPDPGWRWVFGMVATFGLRSHEAFYLDTEDLQQTAWIISVDQGKTGQRLVWACYPEWVEQFDLRNPQLPGVTGKAHSDFTNRWCSYFQNRFPFTALDLRHAWAIRTLACGLPYSEAAAQMGHSVTVHERTYHRWITRETRQKIFDAVMWRDGRPKPPIV